MVKHRNRKLEFSCVLPYVIAPFGATAQKGQRRMNLLADRPNTKVSYRVAILAHKKGKRYLQTVQLWQVVQAYSTTYFWLFHGSYKYISPRAKKIREGFLNSRNLSLFLPSFTTKDREFQQWHITKNCRRSFLRISANDPSLFSCNGQKNAALWRQNSAGLWALLAVDPHSFAKF